MLVSLDVWDTYQGFIDKLFCNYFFRILYVVQCYVVYVDIFINNNLVAKLSWMYGIEICAVFSTLLIGWLCEQ